MQTKFDTGDKVFITGTISNIEITPEGRALYYMRESGEIPFTEDDLIGLPGLLEDMVDRILNDKIRTFSWRIPW